MQHTVLSTQPESASTQPAPVSGEAASDVAAARLPDASDLKDRMPESAKFSRSTFLLTLCLGLVFLVYSYYPPLWFTDLWGHLAYGRLIWTQGSIPETEPLMPLARGMEFINTAWLSQIIGYGCYRAWGITSLQFLYALCITATCGIIAVTVMHRTGRLSMAVICLLGILFLENHQFFVVRPQLAGMVCFAATLVLATRHDWPRWTWIVLPAIFALWANLHGSFVVGLLVLGAMTCGRSWDIWQRRRSFRHVFASGIVRRLFLLTQLAAAACLLNPYGLRIYAEVLNFSSHPNLSDLREWEPLVLRSYQGTAAALAATLLIVLYRLTPRRITGGEVLLLFGLGGAALWTSRMIAWWALVAAYFAAIHLSACLARWRRTTVQPGPRGGLWTVATLGLVWICFAYTPFGYRVVHGARPTPEARHKEFEDRTSPLTPHQLVAWLRENPPQGQVFNPYEWGDYLLWGGPEGLEVFVASHAHLIPEEVWQDYLHTINVGPDWEMNLRRYGVQTVILNKPTRNAFIARLRDAEQWERVYDDHLSAVFVRRNPL